MTQGDSSATNMPPISGPLGIGQVLDRAFWLYRARVESLLLAGALFLVPMGIAGAVVTGSATVTMLDAWRTMFTDVSADPSAVFGDLDDGVHPFASMALGIVGFVLSGAAELSLAVLVIGFLMGREPSVMQGIGAGIKRIFGYIGMTLAQGALLLLAAALGVVIVMVVAAVGVIAGREALPTMRAMFAAGGSQAFIAAMWLYAGLMLVFVGPLVVYLVARFVAALPSLVAEDLGPIAALRRSWHLTSGNVLRSLGFVIVLGVLGFVITQSIGWLSLLLVFVPGQGVILAGAVGAMAQVLWLPIQVAATVLWYYDLRMRRESLDLEQRATPLEGSHG